MRILLALILISMNLNAEAQTSYKVYKDTTDGGQIYDGRITFGNLDRESSFTWLKTGREEYKPDDKAMNLLQFYLRQYTMIVFMGTWCDDSHYLVPKLEKVLQVIRYPETSLTMYGVSRAKTTLGGEHKKYGIVNVPTIILYKDNEEVGRITETVKASVEADLAAIIQADMAGQQGH